MSTMSHNANMISIRVNEDLQAAAKCAASRVGLKISDLGRIGLMQVVESINKTGQITLSNPHASPTDQPEEADRA